MPPTMRRRILLYGLAALGLLGTRDSTWGQEYAPAMGERTAVQNDPTVVQSEPTAVQSEPTAVGELRALPRLSKPHYCWPCNRDRLLARDPLLVQYTRIIGSLGINAVWWGPKHLEPDEMQAAIQVCDQANAGIVVNYSPFHRLAVDPDPRVPNTREFELYRQSLELLTRHWRTWNQQYGANVPIVAVLLDTEKYRVKRDSEAGAMEWNLAIQAKLVPFHTATKLILGADVPVYWYDHGQGVGTPWWRHPPHLPGDGLSASLYSVGDKGRTTRDFNEYCAKSAPKPTGVWVALGGGWAFKGGKRQTWNRRWDYPTETSQWLGAWLHAEPRVNYVVFHPGPFPPHAAKPWPLWHAHFIAYVKGAMGGT